MKATTKSVILFLFIYIGSISILGISLAYHYFDDAKNQLVENLRMGMTYKVKDINARLEYYHKSKSESFIFPQEGYDIALYDKDRQLLASNFSNGDIDLSQLFYENNGYYYMIEQLYKQYLGVTYIAIRSQLSHEDINHIRDEIIQVGIYSSVFLLLIALLLSQIMLYPLKQFIDSLKNFIKNTTHEMNTPISTILMTYEHFEKDNLNNKQIRALDRIEIASKTLSTLYNDLTFISFHDHISYEDTELNIKDIIIERVKFFDTLLQFKDIHVTCHLDDLIKNMDKRKVVLIIDNLLSNAIKFSRKNSKIEITLNESYFSVKDYGMGIAPADHKKIFRRFHSGGIIKGGFGLGLDIVSQICNEYDIRIELISELQRGAEFKLYWKKEKA